MQACQSLQRANSVRTNSKAGELFDCAATVHRSRSFCSLPFLSACRLPQRAKDIARAAALGGGGAAVCYRALCACSTARAELWRSCLVCQGKQELERVISRVPACKCATRDVADQCQISTSFKSSAVWLCGGRPSSVWRSESSMLILQQV